MLNNLVFLAGTAGTGSSVITEGLKTAMQGGIDNLIATFNDVIGIIIPAAIIMICINAGVNFALGKIRGLIGWAQ